MKSMVPYGRNTGGSEWPLATLVREMDNLFSDDAFGGFMAVPFRGMDRVPFRADIKESAKDYVIEAELPGFKKDEIDIALNDGYLTIKAERQTEENDTKSNYLRRERSYTSLARSFTLSGIDAGKISASYRNGILELTLPKLDKDNSGRKIAISE